MTKDPKDPSIVYYGPHPCQRCDPKGNKGTLIVKAGNEDGGSSELEFNFTLGSHYPNHEWLKHECTDITK